MDEVVLEVTASVLGSDLDLLKGMGGDGSYISEFLFACHYTLASNSYELFWLACGRCKGVRE